MPIYEYYCECGTEKETILSYEENDQPQVCACGKVMQRKVSSFGFVMKQYSYQMALDTINKKGNGEFGGMPNRWWRPEAQRKAYEGTLSHQKTVF